MKSSNTIWWVIGVIIILGLVGWFLSAKTPVLTQVGTQATSTDATTSPTNGNVGSSTGTVPTGSTAAFGETYASSPYGFTISYPKELTAQPFDNFMQLNQNDWRHSVTAALRGTPVISIPVLEFSRGNGIATGQPYPLFYTAQVRVGVSTDTTNCYVPDAGYTNQTITNVTINGVTFKKFIFSDAATMKYVSGVSYRTIHNKMCYVIETIQNGSSYRDETMKPGYTDAQLQSFFNEATAIAMTFKFTK